VTESHDEQVVDGRAPRSARRPLVEARLISAVERLTADGRSFSSVSVAELVAEAGIGRATFYLYFADRTAFLLRLVDHARAQIAEPLDVIWGDPGGDRAVLTSAMRAILHRFRDDAAVISAVLEAAAVDPLVAARLDDEMRGFIVTSTTALEAAQRTGAIRPELNPAETAAALTWMVERVSYQVARQLDAVALDARADALSAIVWHSLHPDGQPGL
jgi:TetR/AcrR family transcriptional regulator, ethionamide resistance regulator